MIIYPERLKGQSPIMSTCHRIYKVSVSGW